MGNEVDPLFQEEEDIIDATMGPQDRHHLTTTTTMTDDDDGSNTPTTECRWVVGKDVYDW